MFIDGRKVPENTELSADLAIIGAGPAGITIARALAGKSFNIALIESGGEDFDPDAQALADGEAVGIDYPLETARLRSLGGSSNHWGGWCRPLDAIDFEKREWVPYSGWPITRAQLDAHYRRAQNICQIGAFAYDDPAYWQTASGGKMKPLPLTGDLMTTRFFLMSPPTRFGEVYKKDLDKAKNIKTYLNTTVEEIVPAEDMSQVTHLKLATLTGRRFTMKARFFVLATGGIDNARMLLLSDSVAKNGIGNQNDLVGRFFMEHPHMEAPGWTVIADPKQVAGYYNQPTDIAGTKVCGCFMPTSNYLRNDRLLNSIITFHPREQIRSDGEKFRTDANILSAVRRLEGNALQGDLGNRFGMNASCEQAPNPDSRVSLSDHRDALGMRKVKLDWRLSAQDRDSFHKNLMGLARSFGIWGEGRMQVLFENGATWEDPAGWGHHHMGTTRMGDDPKTSVVDSNGLVHGLPNLYVAGSSVFPTSGSANPTLTLVALSLRLSDHLAGRFPV